MAVLKAGILNLPVGNAREASGGGDVGRLCTHLAA